MEEIRAQMSTIEDPRHPSYVKYALADILIIIMCGVLCGLDTLGDLVVYAKSKADFLRETFGIEKIPFKATFGRILSRVDGKQIGDVILDMLRERFGTMGEVIAVDGKAICSTARGENSHKALQILSTYVIDNGITLSLTVFPAWMKAPIWNRSSSIFSGRKLLLCGMAPRLLGPPRFPIRPGASTFWRYIRSTGIMEWQRLFLIL